MEKIEVLKRAKNRHFLKGLVHGSCPKIEISRIGVFLQKLCQKKLFFNILDRKQTLQDQKIDVLTRAKKWTLFKGVSPWIWSKNQSFSSRRFLEKSYQKRSFFYIVERKE